MAENDCLSMRNTAECKDSALNIVHSGTWNPHRFSTEPNMPKLPGLVVTSPNELPAARIQHWNAYLMHVTRWEVYVHGQNAHILRSRRHDYRSLYHCLSHSPRYSFGCTHNHCSAHNFSSIHHLAPTATTNPTYSHRVK